MLSYTKYNGILTWYPDNKTHESVVRQRSTPVINSLMNLKRLQYLNVGWSYIVALQYQWSSTFVFNFILK